MASCTNFKRSCIKLRVDLTYRLPEKLRPVPSVLGGITLLLTLGTIYSIGNISPYLISYLRVRQNQTVTYADTTWLVAFSTVGQGGAMFAGAYLERIFGPATAALTGGWLASFGVFLTYFTLQQKSFWPVVLTFGLLFGTGIGIAYTPPIVCAIRWLPQRKGLVSGLIVAGFGCGSLVFNQVQTAFVNPLNRNATLQEGQDRYFVDDDVLDRVPVLMFLLAGIYAALQLIGCLLMVDPIREKAPETTSYEAAQVASLRPTSMLRQPEFYLLFTTFLLMGQGVSFVSSFYKAFGQTFISDDHFLALVGSLASLFNAAGRIFWGGAVGDKYGYQVAMACVCLLLTALLLLVLATQAAASKVVYALWVCGLNFHLGAIFALFPMATAKFFGSEYLGVNYGILFTANAVSALIAAFVSTELSTAFGYTGLFQLAAGCSFLGFLAIVTLDVIRFRKAHRKASEMRRRTETSKL